MKPEKIDKKQRRLNENSGFDVSVPEKRRHDGVNVNASGPGPSSTNVRDSYVREPDMKRGRFAEAEQSEPGRGMMFNRNNDRDFLEQPSSNRGFMNIPATVTNPDQRDDRSNGPFDSRNSDRSRMTDDRVMNLIDDRSAAERRQMELRRREFERTPTEREPQFRNDGINEYRMDGQGPSDRQRFQSTEFDKGAPSIGLDRMRGNMRESLFDQRENDLSRRENDFGRRGSDFGRREDDFDRQGNNFNRQGNNFNRQDNIFNRQNSNINRQGNNFDRQDNNFDLQGNNFDRIEVSRRDANFGRRDNDYNRMTDFHDRDSMDDIRDSNNGIRGPIRDNSRDRANGRMESITDSSIPDRRNYEQEMMGSRDGFSSRAVDFQDDLQNRTFDMLSDRRSVSQEFRRLSPIPMLDRSDVNADRFMNQSRDDDAYESLHQFGSRRGDDFLERTQDSGFDMSDRRNDVIDEIGRGQSASNRWDNDFTGRDAYPQEQGRRNFSNDSRRQNDFSGEMNFNSARNNDYDDFPDRNRRDFERRNFDDRFNRFN